LTGGTVVVTAIHYSEGKPEMKIKRDPETLKRLRAQLAASPGWFPELDKLSDEEMADSVERSMNALIDMGPKLRQSAEDMASAMGRAMKPAVEFARAMEDR
jgi:hypothetical protein